MAQKDTSGYEEESRPTYLSTYPHSGDVMSFSVTSVVQQQDKLLLLLLQQMWMPLPPIIFLKGHIGLMSVHVRITSLKASSI